MTHALRHSRSGAPCAGSLPRLRRARAALAGAVACAFALSLVAPGPAGPSRAWAQSVDETAAADGAASAAAPGTSAPRAPDERALAEARAHFQRAVALHDQRDLEGALAEFERAYELAGRPSVLFNISATQQELHRYPEAMRSLRRFLALPGGTSRQRAQAQRALSELERLVARVRVELAPADATLTVDGHEPELENGALVLGPGRHTLEASRAGHQPRREAFSIASGETRSIELRLEALAPEPPPTPRIDPPYAPPVVLPALLAVAGAPNDATLWINNERHSAGDAHSLAPGEYDLQVQAPGMHAFRQRVTLEEGRAHTVRVQLAAVGYAPTAFVATMAVTAAFGAAWAVTGGLMLAQGVDWNRDLTAYEGQMASLSDEQAAQRAQALRDRLGPLALLEVVATTTAVITGVGGLVSAVLGARTEFTPRRSTGALRVAPTPTLPGAGAGAGLTISAPF